MLKPKDHNEKDLTNLDLIIAMQHELNQFERIKSRHIEPLSKHHKVICLKWMCRKNLDEYGKLIGTKLV